MPKSTLIAGIGLILFLLPFARPQAAEAVLEIGSERYRVELASTARQRQRGLMYRDGLAPDRGMLLVYPRAGDHRVWMKNMRIALRVYWIDANHRVIHHARLQPCSAAPCPTYAAPGASRYILELADREHAIEAGMVVRGLSGL